MLAARANPVVAVEGVHRVRQSYRPHRCSREDQESSSPHYRPPLRRSPRRSPRRPPLRCSPRRPPRCHSPLHRSPPRCSPPQSLLQRADALGVAKVKVVTEHLNLELVTFATLPCNRCSPPNTSCGWGVARRESCRQDTVTQTSELLPWFGVRTTPTPSTPLWSGATLPTLPGPTPLCSWGTLPRYYYPINYGSLDIFRSSDRDSQRCHHWVVRSGGARSSSKL